MTIASEIIRLQGAKAGIKSSIESKGVSVPSDATLDEFNQYIAQIDTGSADAIFVPSSFTVNNAIRNSYLTRMKQDIRDIVTSDGNKYVHYFWLLSPTTSSYIDVYRIYAFIKQKGSNPTVIEVSGSTTPADGDKYLSYMDKRVRMKRVGSSSVKLSSLVCRCYWQSGSGRMTSSTWYSYDVVDGQCTITTLMTTQGEVFEPTAAVLAAWEETCGITAEEDVLGIGKTSISLSSGSTGADYNVTATLH